MRIKGLHATATLSRIVHLQYPESVIGREGGSIVAPLNADLMSTMSGFDPTRVSGSHIRK
jgi:hypothetical protein